MQELLNGGTSTAIDSKASNRNQYYGVIKKQGIALVEVWEQNLTNSGRHKVRSLHQTPQNISRANEYLNKLLGRKSDAVGDIS